MSARSTRPDPERLETMLGRETLAVRPHLFAHEGVTLPARLAAQVSAFARDLDAVVHHPGYVAHLEARTAAGPRPERTPDGVCIALDFHVDGERPRLIEINTNAGGGLLALVAARAAGWPAAEVDLDEARFIDQFIDAYHEVRHAPPLRAIALVDRAPETQFLAPEFERFVALVRARGLSARVADPTALRLSNGRVTIDGEAMDLVYWRDTDFLFEAPDLDVLRAAWLGGNVVVSPDPLAHTRWADKRNLAVLSEAAALEALGVESDLAARVAAGVPETRIVTAENVDVLWNDRSAWFFKPITGYGSRGAYRGDKVTQRAFAAVRAGGYVAQRLIPAPRRPATATGGGPPLKWDLRAFVQRGEVTGWMCRVYEGQTTNLRTPGGGIGLVAFRTEE